MAPEQLARGLALESSRCMSKYMDTNWIIYFEENNNYKQLLASNQCIVVSVGLISPERCLGHQHFTKDNVRLWEAHKLEFAILWSEASLVIASSGVESYDWFNLQKVSSMCF